MIKIGRVQLGAVPRLVAIVDKRLTMTQLDNLKQLGVTLLEVRFDLFDGAFSAALEYAAKLKKDTSYGVIGTLRETAANKKHRLSMFEKLVPLVDCVDIEIDAAIGDNVVSLAKRKRVTVIVSEHDFKKTPDIHGLARIVDKAESMGADIVKIAAMAKNRDDVSRLLCFAGKSKANIVAIAMGEYGAISRVLAPLFGSLFTYGFIGKAVAPGQLSVAELSTELTRFFPEFATSSKINKK